jgi:hypothetical protein
MGDAPPFEAAWLEAEDKAEEDSAELTSPELEVESTCPQSSETTES